MSATQIGTLARTFTATVTIDQYLLTKLDVGKAAVATKAEVQANLGFAKTYAAQNDSIAIELLNGGGTRYGVAASTVTAGNALYAASGGKLEAAIANVVTVTGDRIGYSLSTGVADDVIEVLLG